MPYKPIEDYGIIGDLNTSALVGRDGSIDWCCFPHFDSPSLFAAILDDQKGGYFRIYTPRSYRSRQRYIPDTNVLVTRFLSPRGVGEVVDFMPIDSTVKDKPQPMHRIVRKVSAVRGPVNFRMECFPAFDYARASHEMEAISGGVLFKSNGFVVELHSQVPLHIEGAGVIADFVLEEGETAHFIIQQFETKKAQGDERYNPS